MSLLSLTLWRLKDCGTVRKLGTQSWTHTPPYAASSYLEQHSPLSVPSLNTACVVRAVSFFPSRILDSM